MALKGNRGEWSELYAFLRLLSDGRLQITDASLKPVRGASLVAQGILRTEGGASLTYSVDATGSITLAGGRSRRSSVSTKMTVGRAARAVLRATTGSKGTYRVREVEALLRRMRITRLKSSSRRKGDLEVIVRDPELARNVTYSYSIKSQLGEPPTLLNASGATNFRFRVVADGLPSPSPRFDAETGPDLVNALEMAGYRLDFEGAKSETFDRNLRMIDSGLPDIVAELLRLYFGGRGGTISELTSKLIEEDPHAIGTRAASHYRYKIMSLLEASALGMTPGTEWNGKLSADGGLIVVKPSGTLACLPASRRDDFREYLFANTKLDRPYMTRHGYGRLIRSGAMATLLLNLQIRFTSESRSSRSLSRRTTRRR